MSDTIRILNPAYEVEDDNLPEYIELRAKYEVCPSCHGKGKSSAYLGAFTQDDMDEMGEDFRDDYMRGEYDRACDECAGERVILVVDRDNNSPEFLDAYDKWEEEKYQTQRLYEMENAHMNWLETRGY